MYKKKSKQVSSEIKEEFFLSLEKKTPLLRRAPSPTCPPTKMAEFMREQRIENFNELLLSFIAMVLVHKDISIFPSNWWFHRTSFLYFFF